MHYQFIYFLLWKIIKHISDGQKEIMNPQVAASAIITHEPLLFHLHLY